MTLIFILLGVIVVLLFILYLVYRRLVSSQEKYTDLEFIYKSTAVKHGQHWEQFVPFMDDFAKVAQRENFVFIGMPIDGISFDDDAIKFIEVKTGKSQLNKKQQQVKQQVQNKHVQWIELRF